MTLHVALDLIDLKLRKIASHVRRTQPWFQDYEDAYQIMRIGAWQAYERWSPEGGRIPLDTYMITHARYMLWRKYRQRKRACSLLIDFAELPEPRPVPDLRDPLFRRAFARVAQERPRWTNIAWENLVEGAEQTEIAKQHRLSHGRPGQIVNAWIKRMREELGT